MEGRESLGSVFLGMVLLATLCLVPDFVNVSFVGTGSLRAVSLETVFLRTGSLGAVSMETESLGTVSLETVSEETVSSLKERNWRK